MTRDDIRLLFEYDRWGNAQALQAASALTPEQFTRDLGGSFRSVCGTLVHIMGGEWGWLQYWKASSHGAELVRDVWVEHDALFHADAFSNLAEVRRKWAEIETEQAEFLDQVTDESLEKLLLIDTTHVPIVHLMQHLVNHSTYHRGQVAMMLRQLGVEPLPTDFHVFLVQPSKIQ